MTTIDGLSCTWDFKDRLVAAEDTTMRAEYTYDYTDRRVTKKVSWKDSPPTPSVAADAKIQPPGAKLEIGLKGK
jgi:hypothetical protein